MTIDGSLHTETGSRRRSRQRSIDVGIRRRRIRRTRVGGGGDYASRERELASLWAPPLVPFMKYMVPLLLGLVAMKYQGKSETLFVENPAPLWCFVAATCVYWLIVGAMKQDHPTPRDARIWLRMLLSRSAFASGLVSALSLLSVFLHYPFSLLPLVIWTTLSALFIMWSLLQPARFINNIRVKLVMVIWGGGGGGGPNSTTEEASLPMYSELVRWKRFVGGELWLYGVGHAQRMEKLERCFMLWKALQITDGQRSYLKEIESGDHKHLIRWFEVLCLL